MKLNLPAISPIASQTPHPQEYMFDKYQALLKQKNIKLGTFKNIHLPQISKPSQRGTFTCREIVQDPKQSSKGKESLRSSRKLEQVGKDGEGNFLELIDWEAFRKTKQNIRSVLEKARVSVGAKWAENESKSLLKRFKLKVKQETDAINFNITRKYREIKDKQKKALKVLSQQQYVQREKEDKKFTALKLDQPQPPATQAENHIPQIFLKLVNHKSAKKIGKENSKFLSTISQKRVKKIFEMDMSGKDLTDVSTIAGSLPSIP